jgi:hypothetical protein
MPHTAKRGRAPIERPGTPPLVLKRHVCPLSVASLDKWPLSGDDETGVRVWGLFDEGLPNAAWWQGQVRGFEACAGLYTIKYVDGALEEYTESQLTQVVKCGMLHFTALDLDLRR